MNRLARIVRSATPSTAVQFQKSAYGKVGVERFLRDVIAMANASVEGTRYIITGVEFDKKDRKRMYGVDRADFSGKPAYQSLANDHIEPPIRIRYQPVTIEGERVGDFELPMRICVGDELKGRRLGIQYSLFAQNLRTPAKGKIRLLF